MRTIGLRSLRALSALAVVAALTVIGAGLAACGGSAGATSTSGNGGGTTPATTATIPPSSPAPTTTPGAAALTGEAASATAGDIPDNQVFLSFTNAKAGYSMKYPEGWAQKGTAGSVTFRDKNNIVHVVVSSGPTPTVASVKAELVTLKANDASFSATTPQTMTINGATAIETTYTTKSAPSSVTGQSVTLQVDRYYLSHGGKVAIVDLGTPQGVDNVDAYRMMIQSFRWKG